MARCYFSLGLLRDAERQWKSALAKQPMVPTFLQLGKVFVRLDQPANALSIYERGLHTFPGDPQCTLASARLQEAMNEHDAAAALYKSALKADPSNVEAIACLASRAFYSDQPESALRLFRRMLQMGVGATSPELWCNLGVCCFFAGQLDLTLACMDRAISMATAALAQAQSNRKGTEAALAAAAAGDVWYNMGHIAIGIGDLQLAQQAFRVAVSVDSQHAESHANLGVLEMRKGNAEAARASFAAARKLAPHLYEPFYNSAVLAYRQGDHQEAYVLVQGALAAFPSHWDSVDLKRTLEQQLHLL
jgi:tetratricopeptide repeat protein 8